MEWTGLVLGALALALGGVLKGATGAGSPLFAVPLLAMLYDVPLAVAIFTLPSLFSNLWQGWRFRTHRVGPALTWVFAVAGAAGAAAGSVVLISLSSDLLLLGVAGAAFLYIRFPLAHPTVVPCPGAPTRPARPAALLGRGVPRAATSREGK